MKGRKKLPTVIKEQRGTLQKCRVLDNEMKPGAVQSYPMPPDWLNDFAKNEWHNVVSGLYSLGMISKLDIGILTLYANEMGVYYEMEEKLRSKDRIIVYKDPSGNVKSVNVMAYQRIADRAFDKALKIAVEFGFTPSSRTRISVSQAGVKNSNSIDDEFDI